MGDGKTCHPSCKTCSGKLSADCTSCKDKHSFMAVKTIIDGVAKGFCKNAVKSPMNGCAHSACRDPDYGVEVYGANVGKRNVVCSRICMFGGKTTVVKNMQRWKNGKRGGIAKKFMAGSNRQFTSPVCLFHKL